jgi:hypothetical protein
VFELELKYRDDFEKASAISKQLNFSKSTICELFHELKFIAFIVFYCHLFLMNTGVVQFCSQLSGGCSG